MPSGYELQYNPTLESQLNQQYQNILAVGATSALPGIFQDMQGLQDYANFYGGAGAEVFGGFMAGTPAEHALTSRFGGQSGMTLGQYGQLLDPTSPFNRASRRRSRTSRRARRTSTRS